MHPTGDILFAHFDLDTFFVSCERLQNPELNGKAVIVGGTKGRGVVSTCSYEARKFGVHSGMPMAKAVRLCPHAVFMSGTIGLYSKYSRMVTEIMVAEAPAVEKASVDEFYLDVSGMNKYFGTYKWVCALADKITNETGLPISFGLSVNKTMAKMATTFGKPVGRFFVPKEEVQAFLNPLSVGEIPMVGGKMKEKLNGMGIFKIKQLAQTDKKIIEARFGKYGSVLWKKANGIHYTTLRPYRERKSISVERTFHQNTYDIESLNSLIGQMCEKLAHKLRAEKKLATCVAVKIRYPNFEEASKQVKIPVSNYDHVFAKHAKELLLNVYKQKQPLRLMGVRVSNLVKQGYQSDMFYDNPKYGDLYNAIDKVKNKFGKTSVQWSSSTVDKKTVEKERKFSLHRTDVNSDRTLVGRQNIEKKDE